MIVIMHHNVGGCKQPVDGHDSVPIRRVHVSTLPQRISGSSDGYPGAAVVLVGVPVGIHRRVCRCRSHIRQLQTPPRQHCEGAESNTNRMCCGDYSHSPVVLFHLYYGVYVYDV